MFKYHMFDYSPMCNSYSTSTASFCAHFNNTARIISTAFSAVLFFIIISVFNIIKSLILIIKNIKCKSRKVLYDHR